MICEERASGSVGNALERQILRAARAAARRTPAAPARGDSRAIVGMLDQDCLQLGLRDLVGRRRAPSRDRHSSGSAWRAVFGPMPGTPGTLSTLSPISASTSPTFSGGTPNFSSTSSRADPPVVHRVEHVEPGILVDQLHQILVGADDRHLPALRLRRRGVAGDDVVGLQPLFLDARACEKARVASRISGNCGTRSSGGGGRCALYWSYISLRNVCSDASRITAMCVGPSALLRLVGELPQHRRIAIDRARPARRAGWSAAAAGDRRGRCSPSRRRDRGGSGQRLEPLSGSFGSFGFGHEGAGLAGWRRGLSRTRAAI